MDLLRAMTIIAKTADTQTCLNQELRDAMRTVNSVAKLTLQSKTGELIEDVGDVLSELKSCNRISSYSGDHSPVIESAIKKLEKALHHN